jgi:tetratricopeptide (TPR) repeat protein
VSGHHHPHAHASERRPWGEPAPGALSRLLDRARALLGQRPAFSERGLRELPLILRRAPLAEPYLAAERGGDHRRAAAAAVAAMERAAEAEEWWQADLWAHRGLWHFERAQQTLQAARQARRIGDLRVAAGDPASARRYYAEAIDESRDIGAEHEQGRAALGLGRALLELGDVTEARRLASAAIDLLDRSDASASELAAARDLLGTEVAVGEGSGGAAEERH